jgi:mannosyltransferase OCH1-like enzyme
MIPKNIALFYHDKSKITPNMQKNYDVLKLTHPDFNVELYDVNDALEFINKNYDQRIVRAYESLRVYSEESQLFRYCYIYKKGGVFLDIKYECVVNFNFSRLMDREYFCSEQNGIYMGFFVLKPFNPVMKELINNIAKFTEISYNIVGLCKVTGAEAINSLLIEYKPLAEELLWVRIAFSKEISLLPS